MIREAAERLEHGDPVLIYDFEDREGEVDLVYAAEKVDPVAIQRLRNDAGGLICTALPGEAAELLDLPFFSDALDHPAVDDDVGYDSRSSFSLWVNHRSNYTGITDIDRSMTASRLADAASRALRGRDVDFSEEFRSPGHMPVLRAHEDLLGGRQGHTEMSVYLLGETDLCPVAVICEMMDDETGGALSLGKAKRYAERHDLLLMSGDDIVGDARGEQVIGR